MRDEIVQMVDTAETTAAHLREEGMVYVGTMLEKKGIDATTLPDFMKEFYSEDLGGGVEESPSQTSLTSYLTEKLKSTSSDDTFHKKRYTDMLTGYYKEDPEVMATIAAELKEDCTSQAEIFLGKLTKMQDYTQGPKLKLTAPKAYYANLDVTIPEWSTKIGDASYLISSAQQFLAYQHLLNSITPSSAPPAAMQK